MDKAVDNEKKEDTFAGVRKKLTAMREHLMRESKAEIGNILLKDDKYNGVSDDGDIADIACRDSMQAAQYSRHLAQLRAIDEALLRIDEGRYGTCKDCEEEISLGRLNAIPFALRCVDCQEQQERESSETEE
jgi:DnaK suppressor protein